MNYRAVGLLLWAACATFAQSRKIEVATIRPVEFPNQTYFEGLTATGTCGRAVINVSGNRVTVPRVSLCGLIREAYGLQGYRVEGLPKALTEAVRSNYFAVQIQAEGEAALISDEARVLLRDLLEERFQLKFHRETRELPVYTLHVAKSGLKMSSKDLENCDPLSLMQGATKGVRATLGCKATTTIAQLADSLTLETDRPVLNRTDLAGTYVVQLRWSPNDDGAAPSLFTAVQEQLGLKLEAEKAPVEILVVDQVTRPTEN